MTLLGDVEFFADDGSVVGSDEDAVDIGTRPAPRWAVIVAGVLAVSAFFGVLAIRPQPKAATPDSEQALPPVVSTLDVGVIGQVGPSLRVGTGAVTDVRDALVHRNRLYLLRSATVTAVDLITHRVDSVSLRGAYAIDDKSSARLLFDADADRLWVLAAGTQPAQLVEINASRMLAIRRVSLPLGVHDAAAMDGHVYLATSTGLADLAPGATQTTALRGAAGPVSSIAADPARDRILALDVSTPYAVVVVSGHGKATRRTFGNLVKGSIAVVGDAIWVGGYGGGANGVPRALIARLDPITLAPVQTSAVALKVSRIVVSPGTLDIWISTDGPGLWCLDPRTGDVLQHWPTATAPVTSQVGHGPVTSRLASAYAIDAGALVPLVLAGCAG